MSRTINLNHSHSTAERVVIKATIPTKVTTRAVIASMAHPTRGHSKTMISLTRNSTILVPASVVQRCFSLSDYWFECSVLYPALKNGPTGLNVIGYHPVRST